MKRMVVVIGMSIVVFLGCARVRVEAPKEPIKVDVSMRIDVYQHVQKDIDAIEDIVSGSSKEKVASDQHSRFKFFVGVAYAQEELNPSVQEAALRRKERLTDLYLLMKQGIIGENKAGLVEIVDESRADAPMKSLVADENSDRMVIYKELAQKNNASVDDIQKVYTSRLQNDAPPGTLIEIYNNASSSYEWKKK